jgi:acyl-CoA synthetase (AMP-forming)/AMP-acid ligase II
MANERMIQHAMGHSEGLVVVSWLPIYHDMGLIGNLLQALFLGGRCIFMSPAAFLQKPRRWLAAISTYRAQFAGGPNFAFRLCTKAIRDDQKAGLDLRTLNVLFCGSEPIDAMVLEEFADAFRETGFRRESLLCCYGMAEATLMATGTRPGDGPVYETVDGDAMAANEALPAHVASTNRRVVVSSGRPVEGQDLAIVEPASRRRLGDGQVGEIWLRGANIARGYWRKPELTSERFAAHLSEADGGEDHFGAAISASSATESCSSPPDQDHHHSRRNHYPHDIELTVQSSHPPSRGRRCRVSVMVDGEAAGRGAGNRSVSTSRAETAVDAIWAAIAEEHEIAPYTILLYQNGAETWSGKIQRSACVPRISNATFRSSTNGTRRFRLRLPSRCGRSAAFVRELEDFCAQLSLQRCGFGRARCELSCSMRSARLCRR